MSNLLTSFYLDSIHYYYTKSKYYADNGTIRETITEKEYKDSLMTKLAGI